MHVKKNVNFRYKTLGWLPSDEILDPYMLKRKPGLSA